MKEVTITIHEDTASDFADILCWMTGYIEAKGDDWKHVWLLDSLQSLRDVKKQITNTTRNEYI